VTASPWEADWWRSAAEAAFEAWRGVEAQHAVATMRLVDSIEEQEVLEQLLEDSKPPLPPRPGKEPGQGKGKGQSRLAPHYLAFTPFRYLSPFASRFRRANEPGVWYGADSVETACTELAWWGHRLLTDSDGLIDQQLLTEFTVFPAGIRGLALELRRPPWSGLEALWVGEDYVACQLLAEEARQRQVAVLRYASVRHVAGGCCAVLDLAAITAVGVTRMQTWYRRVSREVSTMTHRPSGKVITVTHEA